MDVLVVEDDDEVRWLVTAELLRREIQADGVPDVAAALDALRNGRYDVVVLDLRLPDGSGLDVLRFVRAARSSAHVLVLSGVGTETDRVRALELGADDYVVKPCSVRELGARVAAVQRRQANALGTLRFADLSIDLESRDVVARGTSLELTAKEFDLLAFLAARPRHVFSRAELLAAVWESDPEWQQPSTVTEHVRRLRAKLEEDASRPQLLRTVRGVGYRFDPPAPIDDDPAESAGRRDGHEPQPSEYLRHLINGVVDVSDAVIVTDGELVVRGWNGAAERLYGWPRDEVIGRRVTDLLDWLGDREADADAVASLRDHGRWFGRATHLARDGRRVEVNATTTSLQDEDGTLAGLVSVNRPLRQSARAHRGHRRPAAHELRRAVENDEFTVHFQPLVDLRTRRVIAAEALARWHRPGRPSVQTDAFIEAAESSGLILELGRSVLRRACRQAAEWQREGAEIGLTVNLSARQLADERLAAFVAATLDDSGLSPTALCLEVTETSLVRDVDQARRRLHELAALGATIAIDDFGTGWASLAYLKQFPVHTLKIDGMFVAGLPANPRDAAIARSVVGLGRDLGLLVVGEGVETIEQRDSLAAMGCPIGQGHLFGHPMPGSEFLAVHGMINA